MGKTGASSWLSAMVKALSPTKGSEGRGEQEGENHKRGKRRWIFRKPSPYERTIEHKEAKNIASPFNAKTTSRKSTDQGKLGLRLPVFEEVVVPDKRRAMAVAIATTAAAEAAVVTAQAAVEVIRLASPSVIVAENYAAVAIQTAFRAYLARRALKALKGVVKLQAYIRGYNMRNRAKITLQCMQSLLRVQNQVCDQRKRLSADSKFSPPTRIYQIAEMKSNSRGSTSSVTEDEDNPHKSREANIKRQNSLANAFYRQILRSENLQSLETSQQEEKTNPRERTPSPYSPISRQNQHPRYSPSSPIHTKSQNLLINSLTSPHRSRIRTLKSQSQKTTFPDVGGAPFGGSTTPGYMAATESATARVRSKSAPRQRPPLDRERERERERGRENGLSSAKKRLFFAGKDLK